MHGILSDLIYEKWCQNYLSNKEFQNIELSCSEKIIFIELFSINYLALKSKCQFYLGKQKISDKNTCKGLK